ncbi:MAG: RNA-binding domain-containing protein [Candidatus Enteromonas sp.]
MNVSEIYPGVIAEDKKFEFKLKLNENDPLGWAKSVVGFANGEGGWIFVGVANNGEAVGLPLSEIDGCKNRVAQVNDRHIFPHVNVNFDMRSVDPNAERFILGIQVRPSDSLVRYRDGDYRETVYVRGDGNVTPARPEEIISLAKRKYGVDNEPTDVPYVESEWRGFLALCRNYRQGNTVPNLKELQSMEILTERGFAKSGFLMFKDDYGGEDTMVACRLWSGKDKTGFVLDGKRFKGSLPSVFEQTLSFLERNTKIGWVKTENGGRESLSAYPFEAVREALVNAIAHRDYSIFGTQIDVDVFVDRIEITSPGSWMLPRDYAEYPLGDIPSIRRNPILAATLDAANLMERGGTGFETIVKSYRDSPEELQPVVSIYPGFLKLRLFDRQYQAGKTEEPRRLTSLSDADRLLEILRVEGPKPVRELQEEFGYSSRPYFLRKIVTPLLKQGKIVREGARQSPTSRLKWNDGPGAPKK